MKKNICRSILLLAVISSFSSCKKIWNLPDEKDYISDNMSYSNKVLAPVMGRTNLITGFNSDYSTNPLKFEIINAHYGDGTPVKDIFQVRKNWVWTSAYTGLETSLEEIQAKRKQEDHPLFEVRSSGEFIMWPASNSSLVTPTTETILDATTRYFDLKISNSGGERIIKDFQVLPYRERPYEPSTDIDQISGLPKKDANGNRVYIKPTGLYGMVGEASGLAIDNLNANNTEINELVAYIRPYSGGNGHSLRFKFLDKDSLPINPGKFNQTRWDKLIHGFNMEKTNEYVKYDVAYPIPLVNIATSYASGGFANVNFSYSRKGFGGIVATAGFGFSFSLYSEGDWEIVFHFKTDNPKFEDE